MALLPANKTFLFEFHFYQTDANANLEKEVIKLFGAFLPVR